MKTRLHKILSIFLVAVMLLTAAPLSGFVGLDLNLDWLDFTTRASAAATGGTCGNGVGWSYSGTTLTISGTGGGTGVMTNYNCSYETPWDDYDSAIRKVIIGNGVTKIGKNAFAYLYHLTGVTISESVTVIGDYAFSSCHSLTSITIPDSVTNIGMYAFDSCSLLEEVKMGNNVKNIGDCAFRGCEIVESITIPASVTNIGVSVFSDCDKLILELEKDSCAETYAIDNNIPYYYLYDAGEENIISVTVNSNLSFQINKETCTMTINCLGDMGSFEIGNAPWAYYEPYVKHVIISEGCTSIGANAFYSFEGLIDVMLAESVVSIDDYAFYNSRSITSVENSENVTSIGDYAFYNCSKLTDFFITNVETSIGEYAFYNCLGLVNFKITKGINSVGNSAFYGCSSLTNVKLSNALTTISKYAFYDCSALFDIIIPESVTTIGFAAFYNCSSLTSIIIPDSVISISGSAFRYCSGLTSITIGNNVKGIASNAFRDCISIANVTIPDSVTSMGEAVFKGCIGLERITLSDNLESISKSMFYECTSLTDIVIPDGVTSIGNDAFYGCSSLASVNFGKRLSTIGTNAFNGCLSLNSVVIPDCVTTISSSVFENCTGLTNITISDNVTTISSSAFENCTSLTNITIPDSVTVIGNYAFYRCSGLLSVYLPISVLSVGGYSFSNCNKLEKLRVYNPNCYFETGCISNNTIICGYSDSTAETYAKEKGYKFELITDGDHEHIYSNSCDSECNICGYVNLNAGHTYKTVVHNPTCQNEGFTVCICTVCKYAYVSEITDTVDHDMRWVVVTKPTSSADGVKNYSCSYCGLVEDTKVVPAFLISDKSVANIDFDSNTISGFDAGAKSIDDYVTIETDGYSFTCDSAVIGTGTVIELTDGDTVITEFTAVVFGDVNGDGWYDGTDSIIVSCLANGLLSKDDVSPAFYTAADCNHDGVIDSFDVALLEKAGILLADVDQSKSSDELATDEAYIEYLDLIDQSPETELEEDETPKTEDKIETPETEEFSIFEFIIGLIKKLIELILSYIPVPLK